MFLFFDYILQILMQFFYYKCYEFGSVQWLVIIYSTQKSGNRCSNNIMNIDVRIRFIRVWHNFDTYKHTADPIDILEMWEWQTKPRDIQTKVIYTVILNWILVTGVCKSFHCNFKEFVCASLDRCVYYTYV